ncbi:MAG: AzlC family ABC transporter permease [Lachnospiraceae bacterium]|nr:AzlC family ABC transporter permease [Lachnospiraceae bacterium]
MNLENFKKGLKAGIPIGLGYFAVSFTFGMMAVKGGLNIWESVLISLTNLTSAGQFAGLDIIFANGTLWEMAFTQIIINLRYMLMSLTISQKLDKRYPFFHRFFISFGMTDEIFGVSAASSGKVSPFFHYGAMAVAIPGWTLGTLVGAVAGSILPNFIISALSVAIYGMFLAIIIPPAKKNKTLVWVIILAMALSSAFKYIPGLNKISSGFSIIIVTVLVAALAAWLRPVKEEEEAAS